ncbi:unnamed protein product [Symbiodinium sp. CCMP2592]|nr:unnamed protein product [Symbiodinium sp. CCMP2592]
MAEGEEGTAKEDAPPAFAVPSDLSLSYFYGRDDLADCAIRLPALPGEEAQEVKCHRLALCSCSGFFFRSFLEPSEQPTTSELPTLPDDAELRRQMPIPALFQLILRFAYAAQRWEALENQVSPGQLPGLYALALLLEARLLAEAAYSRLDANLSPSTAASLLYLSQLCGSSEDFRAAKSRCLEVVRGGFGVLCDVPASLGLVCKLPVDVLVTLLEDDSLEVSTEGRVLQAVRHTLWRRLPRTGRSLKLSGRLCASPALQAEEGLQLNWQLQILENSLSEPSVLPAPPVERFFAAGTAPAAETAPGEGSQLPELSLRLPGDAAPVALLRATRETGEVGVTALLSLESLPEGEEPSAEAAAEALDAEGKPAGTVRFTWTVSEAAAEEAPSAEGEEAKEEGGEKEVTKAPTPPDALLTNEEVQRLLATVRFPHLEHKDLLAAMKDPILAEAGAQQHILAALSSRLSQYEAVDGAATSAQPRPSTVRRGPPGPGSPRAPPPPPMEEESGAQSPLRSTLGRGTQLGVSGVALFPCSVCSGQGRMQLRHVGDRWSARCSRHASCGNTQWLPSCVVAAAVDGHCGPCSLRMGAEVRTLSIRIGRDQQQTLLRLPSGTDTLRGMCIAGCHDLMSLLGA